jgi:hypothetical protein
MMSSSTSHRDRSGQQGARPAADPSAAGSPVVGEAAQAPAMARAKPPVPIAMPASASAPPSETVVPKTVDPHGEDDVSVRKARWRNVPCWLVSGVFHAIVLLVMALTFLTLATDRQDQSLLAQIEGQEMEELEVATLDARLDDVELEQGDALPVGIDDPGLAALGELKGMELDSVVDVGQLATMTDIGDVGALFGKDGKGWTTAGQGMGGAEFYGVKASGNRFVFVVDGSNSMGRENKWPECQRELLAAMSKLRKHQYFYVYLFSRRTDRMFGQRDRTERMVRATPENIERLRRWLYGYELQGGTVPHGALQETLEKLRPDAVYVLSDGQFTDKGGSERYLLDFARTKNNIEDSETGIRRRVAVHTIAFHSRRGEIVLKGISDAFQSTFKYVPAGRQAGRPPGRRAGRPADR